MHGSAADRGGGELARQAELGRRLREGLPRFAGGERGDLFGLAPRRPASQTGTSFGQGAGLLCQPRLTSPDCDDERSHPKGARSARAKPLTKRGGATKSGQAGAFSPATEGGA